MGYDARLPEWNRLEERDKRKHVVAGAAFASVVGIGAFLASAFILERPLSPLGAGAVGMVAAMLAGTGKEAADAAGNALDPAERHGVEVSDVWATWLGGALGAVAAVLLSALLMPLM